MSAQPISDASAVQQLPEPPNAQAFAVRLMVSDELLHDAARLCVPAGVI